MVILERWPVLQGCSLQWRESGHVTEVVSLREGEWSCYVQYKEGRLAIL